MATPEHRTRVVIGMELPSFDFQPRTRLVFGAGSVDRVGELAAELGAAKALLVTDAGIVAAGHAAKVQASLQAAGLIVTLFDQVRENPTTRCVDNCMTVARAAGVDTIIGLGGGSAMDTAKGCNFILTNGGRMQDYWGVGKATKPMLPFIAIPTTAGTGSEMQSAALIADEHTHPTDCHDLGDAGHAERHAGLCYADAHAYADGHDRHPDADAGAHGDRHRNGGQLTTIRRFSANGFICIAQKTHRSARHIGL